MKRVFSAVYGYLRDTDKLYYALCLSCTALSVVLLLGMYEAGFFTRMRLVYTQLLAAGIGLLGAVILSKMDYHTIAKLWKLHVPLAYTLVLMTFLFGTGRDGVDDQAWLPIPFIGGTIQPSELLKISFIVAFALHLSEVQNEINNPKVLATLVAHGAAPILLVMLQGDHGTALVFLVIFAAMLFVAGIHWKYIFMAAGSAVALLPIVWFFIMDEDKRMRVRVMLNPALDPQNTGWQQLTGRIAIGSGRMWGVGIFADKHQYVPEIYNDFIFSFIGEALGFVGTLVVIFLLCGICGKALLTGGLAGDYLGRYICVGVFAMMAFQVVVNIGMNIGLMPVVGITLPFFSSGGSSLLSNYLAMGLVLSVYMGSKPNLFSKR